MMELITPSVLTSLRKFDAARQAVGQPAASPTGGVRLSPRERQILELMSAGRTDKEIAQQLEVSFWTVRTHVSALLRKMGARNRTEAVAAHR